MIRGMHAMFIPSRGLAYFLRDKLGLAGRMSAAAGSFDARGGSRVHPTEGGEPISGTPVSLSTATTSLDGRQCVIEVSSSRRTSRTTATASSRAARRRPGTKD